MGTRQGRTTQMSNSLGADRGSDKGTKRVLLGCSGHSRQGLKANWGAKARKEQGGWVGEGGYNGVSLGFRKGRIRVGSK